MARLTDKTLAQSSAITPTTLIHIVYTGDTSQNPAGSSYKVELQQLNVVFSGLTFTGGSVNGASVFTNGLTANTISATTYQNLPVSGLTEGNNINISGSNGNYTISVTGITGGSSIDPYYNSGSGSTITWDVSGQSTNYEATLTASTTLNLTNVRNGEYGTLVINQPSVGYYNISLGTVNGAAANHRVVNGAGGILLTSTSNAIDIISFTYNGTKMFWTVGNDYV